MKLNDNLGERIALILLGVCVKDKSMVSLNWTLPSDYVEPVV